MKIINSSFEIVNKEQLTNVLPMIERIARTCYQSEKKITQDSYISMIQKLIDRGHEAMIEFGDVIVRVVCDRGVSHELVRHRLASFAQESTRYCNYNKDKFDNQITVIDLATGFKYDFNNQKDCDKYAIWTKAMQSAEYYYNAMIDEGASPQEARSVLPNSLKTEINIKMDFRSWRNFFKLRTAKAAHPQMREIAIPMLIEFKKLIPIVFDDIEVVE